MFTCTEEEVTPQTAKAYLDSGHNIRNRSQNEVERLADVQRRGKFFPLNGETIKFDEDGHLADGQHRLAAQVLSGKTYRYLIVRGVPKAVVDVTVDQGNVRRPGDIIGAAGIKNANVVANLAYWYFWYNTDQRPNRRSSIEQFLRFATQVPGVGLAAAWGTKVGHQISLPGGQISLLHLLATQAGRGAEAERFLNKLGTGVGLNDKSDPILILRNRLLNVRQSAAVLPPEDKFTLFIKTWNLYFQDLTVQGKGLNTKPIAGQDGRFPRFVFHKAV